MNKKIESEQEIKNELYSLTRSLLEYLKDVEEYSDMTSDEFRVFFQIHLSFKDYLYEKSDNKSGAFRIEFEDTGPYYDEDILEMTGLCEDHWQEMKLSLMKVGFIHLICPCCDKSMTLCKEEEVEEKKEVKTQ